MFTYDINSVHSVAKSDNEVLGFYVSKNDEALVYALKTLNLVNETF